MNFLKKFFNAVTICGLLTLLMSLSCSKDEDEVPVTLIRDFTAQRNSDMEVIEKFLYENTYEINANQDIIFKPYVALGTARLKELPTSGSIFPQLRSKNVSLHSVNGGYTVYYIVFNEGNTAKRPTILDEVFTAYRGIYLQNTDGVLGVTEEFETTPYPTSLLSLTSVIRGWREIFPLFGTGTVDTTNPNGPSIYQNFGVGAIFIPSGLAYFNEERREGLIIKIPSYSPLVFTIKLYDVKRADQDGDKVESMNEIVRNADDTFTLTDTDADGTPDYADIDDDNDGFPTLNEITKLDGSYYNFIDIPNCTPSGTVKKHLDSSCK